MSKSELRTLDEVMNVFLTYAPSDMKGHYRLERMEALLTHLGNPQETLKVIHIAGTSGKTSTSYFIRNLLEASGAKTGLTVSPHITAINERLQIDGIPLEATAYIAYANEFLDLIGHINLKPTYFELLIAMAYWVFAKEQVDYAVVETGLGGLRDGTNVVSRRDKICVITDIGLDHTEILGDTLPAIAAQKAGIIHYGNHVFVRRQADEIFHVIASAATAQHATLTVVEEESAPEILPFFQRHNWALALAVLRYLQKREGLPPLTRQQEEDAASHTPPGRWELYHYNGKTIILDGAHNPQKLRALYDSMQAEKIAPVAVLANLIKAPDSKITQSLEILKAISSHLIVTEFSAGPSLKSRSSMPAADFAKLAKTAGIPGVKVEPDHKRALALLLARPEKTVLVTGSLYLVGLIRKDLRAMLKTG